MSLLSWLRPSPASEPGPAEEAEAPPAMGRALLEALPDPALLLDSRGSLVEANGLARSVLPALRIGSPLSFALRVPDVLDAVKSVAGGTPHLTIEYVDRVPLERFTEAHVGAVQADRGGERLVLLLLRDLTPVRRAERMRVDFVANASHELRTPLASLLGFVETLQGPARNDPSARERFLEIMRVQAMRMARLIDDLLSLSRIELRAHLPPDDPVDLVSVAIQVADALSQLARDRGVTIDLALKERSILVRGDRDELIRVVENLVENAIKYGGAGGRVELTVAAASPRADEASISTRDFGPGIGWEHLPRLTERFYRVDVADSREKGGTGLGLALVKHIVARHRGRLDISSKPGEGACFTVVLPALAAEAKDPVDRHRDVTSAS